MALIIKVGGVVAAEDTTMATVLADMAAWSSQHGEPVILVHGGGKAVTEMAGRLGITSTFQDGVRVTKPEEMALVDMVLAGHTNTELVRLAWRAGIPAVGLTGADAGLLVGRLLFPDTAGRTADTSRVNLQAVHAIHIAGLLPIVATVGVGEDGGAVNINADEAAQAIAQAWVREDPSASVRLCFLSDMAGVLNRDGRVIHEISVGEVESLVHSGVARDGMAAKLRSCAEAVQAGVRKIVIGGFGGAGDLERLLSGANGTTISGTTISGTTTTDAAAPDATTSGAHKKEATNE